MKLYTKNGLKYYAFEHFEKTGIVKHAFSTRHGGVSEGCFSSMNLGFSRGDDREKVLRNYEILCDALDIDASDIVFSSQTHTTTVIRVTKEDRGNGIARENRFCDVDGLATNDAQTALVTFYADCVPIFLLDPVKRAICLAHAGWRGTLYKIAGNAVKLMESEFKSNPLDILAGIAPSIGQCCFETDAPVYTLFEECEHAEGCVKDLGSGKKNVDLWEVNRNVLMGAGLRSENIEVAGICTKCNSDIFFSHRVQGNERGSLAAIIELRAESR